MLEWDTPLAAHRLLEAEAEVAGDALESVLGDLLERSAQLPRLGEVRVRELVSDGGS